MATTIKPQVYPTGMLQWQLPETKMTVLWAGEGSPLMLVMPDGRTQTSVEGYRKPFNTAKEAIAAFAEFMARDGA